MIADATLGHCDAVKGSYPFWISAADIMVFNMFDGNFDKFEKKFGLQNVSSFGLQYVSSNFS